MASVLGDIKETRSADELAKVSAAAEREMAAARSSLMLDAPWYGTIAMSQLTPRQDWTCETAWTDGRTMGYNPDFVRAMPHAERVFLWAHEVEHITRKHHLRQEGRDHGRWNQACDRTINPGLIRAGFTMPQGGLNMGPHEADQSAEEIYRTIPEKTGEGGGGQGKGPGDGQSQPGQGGGQGGQGKGPEMWGEVRQPKGEGGGQLTPGEIDQMDREINVAIVQAAMVAKKRGKLPAHVQALLDEIGESKMDWREHLRRFATEVGKNDTRWSPPNRRYIYQGLYLPSLYSEEIGEGWLVMDTSGSTFDKLNEFAAEIQTMVEQFGSVLNVLYCDAKVHEHVRIEPTQFPLVLEPRGGGGTDFRPPFEWLEEQGITPNWLVYFTDMMGTFPEREPGFPVMWAKWGNWTQKPPPFGELIEVDDLD